MCVCSIGIVHGLLIETFTIYMTLHRSQCPISAIGINVAPYNRCDYRRVLCDIHRFYMLCIGVLGE